MIWKKIYPGQLIAAAAIAVLFWSLPLVIYSLYLQSNPANSDLLMQANRVVGGNWSVMLFFGAFVAGWALFSEVSARGNIAWNFGRASMLAILIVFLTWMPSPLKSTEDKLWWVDAAMRLFLVFGAFVCTRYVAREVARLEGRRDPA